MGSINTQSSVSDYSVSKGAAEALKTLIACCGAELPSAVLSHVQNVRFVPSSHGNNVYFPTPCKEQETCAAIKALEACAAAALADLRYGKQSRTIEVDMDRVACFLMSAYLTTIDGKDKTNPAVRKMLPDTDLNQAQSILYRRLSANLYETKNPGQYYHIHGSLEASKTLEMIGLPPFDDSMVEYRDCINKIENQVKKFTAAELDVLNEEQEQAGIQAFKWSDFCETPHGKSIVTLPPFTVHRADGSSTRPACFPEPPSTEMVSQPQQVLQGIKVVELCRVIAGPTIGRSLAALGASVLKVTCPRLPDVPFFQVDVNTGKHTTSLDYCKEDEWDVLRSLILEADVIIDGYRPQAMSRRRFGPESLSSAAGRRDQGFVYVTEDCFGGQQVPGPNRGPGWSHRRGWQQTADCATGVAWAQGRFMGLDEPVVPPFPMSDYGTGALGSVAALVGLYRRATEGNSWVCRTSLCQYDVLLMKLGEYQTEVQERVRAMHDPEFFALRHHDSVDEVSLRAKKSMERLFPHLFAEGMMQRAWSSAFAAKLMWPKEAVKLQGLRIGYTRPARPNGWDKPTWEDWEEETDVMDHE